MSTKSIVKSARIAIAAVLAVILAAVNLPFTAAAAVDDFFADDRLYYLVTSEGDGSAPGAVTAFFNESVDPATVTSITVPDVVKNGDNSYKVTEFANGAFNGCTSLETLDLSACTALTCLGEGMFFDCAKLASIILPCDFDKSLFEGTGVVPDEEDGYKIEYTLVSAGEENNVNTVTVLTGGKFTYVHDWKVNAKNYAEHICSKCSQKAGHTWQLNEENTEQHICTVCGYAEAHYSTMPTCSDTAECSVCGATFKKAPTGEHAWYVISDKIAATTAEYKCNTCQTIAELPIGVNDSDVSYNEKKLKTILQDPYKVLPDGTTLKTTLIDAGSARYNELLANLDATHKVENVVFFELDLYDARGAKISGILANKVRVLLQIPDGWDKEELEAVLVMDTGDLEFEESIVTIDGVDYLAFWTGHFSPYAMIDVKTDKDARNSSNNTNTNGTKKDTGKKSPVMGAPEYSYVPACLLASASAIALVCAVYTFTLYKKEKEKERE